MKFNLLIGLLFIAISFAISGCTKNENMGSASAHHEHQHEDHYTCPMHPDVVDNKASSCPICGMALVKVSKNSDKSAMAANHDIHITDWQLQLAGISPYTVEKKDLSFSIPVTGRILSERRVAFQLYESDLQIVKTGQSIQGSSAAAPNNIINGRISHIDSIVDPMTRTIRVTGVLNHSIKPLLIDGSFHGEIEIELADQILVPEEAVLHTGHRDLVYLITDNHLRPVAVELGKKTQQYHQVLSGLNEGDIISSGPNFLIDSETKIRGGNDQTHH